MARPIPVEQPVMSARCDAMAATVLDDDPVRRRVSEPPARRTRGLLGRTDCGRGARPDLVDEPRRRSERRRVERGGDAGSRFVRLRWPSALGPQRRDLGHDGRAVTRRASPETITSKPCVATLIVQRGSRATFFALRVRSPVWNQHEPACQSAPTLVTCGLPSAFRVVSQNVGRSGERGSSCVWRSTSCASTWAHSIVGSPSASARFAVCMVLETPSRPETHRQALMTRVGIRFASTRPRPREGAHHG